MEVHIDKLSKICRVCSCFIKLLKKRKPKQATELKEAFQDIFKIILENDDKNIHPRLICENCRKLLVKAVTLKKQGKCYNEIAVVDFQPHCDECIICSNKKSSGRPKALKQLNQFSDNFKKTVTVDLDMDVVHDDDFDEKAAKLIGERLGYAFIPNEENVTFVMMHQSSNPFVQLRNLVTIVIDIHNKCWKIYVAEKDISKEKPFVGFPLSLTTESVKKLLEKCENLIFCSGNQDFPELCLNRRKEANMACFTDRGNNIVAKEVSDTVCLALGFNSTVRHGSCRLISDAGRCDECIKYRATLTALNFKLKHKEEPKKELTSMPHKFMSREQLLAKLSIQKCEKVGLKKENHKLKTRINFLINEKGVETSADLSSVLQTTIEKTTNEFVEGSAIHLLFEEQLKQARCKSSKQMRWHPLIIRWCLGIYHTSPTTYDFLKRSCFLKLPHKSTLLDYSIYTKPQSGFNPDVLKRLYEEADVPNLKPHEKNFSLLFDEMKIQEELVYSKSSGQLIGFVDLGAVNNEINKFERQCSVEKERKIATSVLAFMVRGIYTNFTFTFAYFPTCALSCGEIFPLAWDAVAVLESISLKVRCFVCDGASSNRSFYKMHRLENSSLPFMATNMCGKDRKVYLICDVPHLIKTVRNNWENSHGNRNTRNLMYNSCSISWNHLVSLKEFDSNSEVPGLYLTKLKHEHIKLTPSSRMNVRLAAQCLSSTVAGALQFQGKPDTKGTEEFVRKFDYFFDCLNGQYSHQGTHTRKDALKPYQDVDDARFKWLQHDFIENYINKWENQTKAQKHLNKTERKKLCLSVQTIEGLRITVPAFVNMVKILLIEYPGSYVLSGRFSQDPLEQHFSAQRRRCGSNTNPNAEQFGYNELALHTIKSKNVASIRGNTKVDLKNQTNLMSESEVPLKRRKR